MKLVEAIGIRVKNLLDDAGMTQYELSKQGGIPRSTISVIIGVKRNSVKTDTLYQIASSLGITLKDFFDDPIFDEVTD